MTRQHHAIWHLACYNQQSTFLLPRHNNLLLGTDNRLLEMTRGNRLIPNIQHTNNRLLGIQQTLGNGSPTNIKHTTDCWGTMDFQHTTDYSWGNDGFPTHNRLQGNDPQHATICWGTISTTQQTAGDRFPTRKKIQIVNTDFQRLRF